jgi:hypothetical protein
MRVEVGVQERMCIVYNLDGDRSMSIEKLTLLAKTDRDIPESFCDWLRINEHVWDAFVVEAFRMIDLGFSHYSARTIVHYLRHHSAISENGSHFKISNNWSPYLARLFAMVYPDHKGIFSYHSVVIAKKEAARNEQL